MNGYFETYKELLEQNRIQWRKANESGTEVWRPYQKFYLEGRSKQLSNLWQGIEGNKKASIDIKNLFGAKLFDFPKPIELLERCISISTGKNDIVLDFFAGSATTAHAVLRSNMIENANRRFILVQLPEKCVENTEAYKNGYKTISCIAKERVRRAAAKIKEDNPSYKSDLGFKSYKLANSNIRCWNPDFSDVESSLLSHSEHLIEGRTEQDILYELLLKRGVDLAVPIESRQIKSKSIYSIGYGALFACLDESISREQVEDIAQAIINWHRELAPASDTHVFLRDSAFRDDISKTNMAAILEQNGISHVRSL